MRRRLLCWAIVATLISGCCTAAHAQGLSGRMGGRAVRGGRMGMGRGTNDGSTITSAPAATAAPSAEGVKAVPASTQRETVAAPGVVAGRAVEGAVGLPGANTPGLTHIDNLRDRPAAAAVANGLQTDGLNVGNGLLSVGGGRYPSTSVLATGLAGRRMQRRGAQEVINQGAAALLQGNVPGGPWHAGYYETAWGRPMPLVVPPTATHQTDWGWGIANTRVTRIYPQFGGPYNGYPYDPAAGMGQEEQWRPSPYWPSDTSQFGVYYIRGPW